MTDEDDAREGRGVATLASTTFDRLRTDILTGQFKPEERLRIDRLKDLYDVGSTPVREALNRLVAEGLVKQSDQRGFAVAPLTIEDLLDLTKARTLLYDMALREAIAKGDMAWEEGIVLAYHRLSRTEPEVEADGVQKLNEEWRRLHKAFHRSLIAAVGSTHLLNAIDDMFDMADRYRFLPFFSSTPPTRDTGAEHQALMEATLARDSERATSLLKDHIDRTARVAERFAEASEGAEAVPTSRGRGRKPARVEQ